MERAIDDLAAAVRLGSESPHVWRCLAASHQRTNEFEEALAVSSEFITRFPQEVRHEDHCIRGLAHEGLQDYDRALADFDRANDLSPRNPDMLVLRSRLRLRRREFDSAIVDATAAIEVNHESALAYHCRAYALQGLGRTKEATADWREADRLYQASGELPNMDLEEWIRDGAPPHEMDETVVPDLPPAAHPAAVGNE